MNIHELFLLLSALISKEVVLSKVNETEGKSPLPFPVGDLTHIPHKSAPLLVDPSLCDELRKGYHTEDVTEGTRIRILLDLCAGKKISEEEATKYSLGSLSSLGIKRKRETGVKSLMSPDHKKMMLDMHNEYRRNVTPQAADMKLMKWDDFLADTAQMWSDRCDFVHGFPDEVLNKKEAIGQNLYIGTESTGYRAMKMWHEEYEFFDFETLECEDGEQCGHYVQMIWGESEYVGCGVARCISKGYLITCHYSPAGNVIDMAPYLVGKPCSQCPSKRDGGLCYKKTCVTNDECKKMNLDCSCNLKCHNCATLSKKYCRCSCKMGWDSLDCSKPCGDEHILCNNNPGFPDPFSCSLLDGKVRDFYCRKMCKQCKYIDSSTDSKKLKNSHDYCCEGTPCDVGNVLNVNTCECELLCPGPNCLEHNPEDNDYIIHEKSTTKSDLHSKGFTGKKDHKTDEKFKDEALQTPKTATKLSNSPDISRIDWLTFCLLLSVIFLLHNGLLICA